MNFKKIVMLSAFAVLFAAPAMAQDAGASANASTTAATDPGHPRVNEVDQRLQDQQNRVNTGVANGQIASPKRAAADEARDAHISAEASKDEAANNGHLTKPEQRKLNRQLNRNSRKIHTQRHNQPAAAAKP